MKIDIEVDWEIQKRLTNREYMIGLLHNNGFIDDGRASYEAMLFYSVKCPYFTGDKRAFCDNESENFYDGFRDDRERCYFCKEQWLDSEVDE